MYAHTQGGEGNKLDGNGRRIDAGNCLFRDRFF